MTTLAWPLTAPLQILLAQIFLLLLAAYFLGCLFGCLLRRIFYRKPAVVTDGGGQAVFVPKDAGAISVSPEPEPASFVPPVVHPAVAAPATVRPVAEVATPLPPVTAAPVVPAAAPPPPPPPPSATAFAATPGTITAAAAAKAATASPASAAPRAPAVAPSVTDDLKRIRNIDAALESRLNGAGITRYEQIAAWTAGDVARFSGTPGLAGRIGEENWIEQAQVLARGGETDYARRQRVAAVGAVAHRANGVTGDEAASQNTAPSGTAKMAADGAARPVHLADALRENREAPAKTRTPASDTSRTSRSNLSGLRSVRSEALRDIETPVVTDRIDDLKRIRGIGVLIEKRLNALGVTAYEQIANWTGGDIDRISSVLEFKGRIERENWIEQARILASGGHTEFSRRVDRGEVETSRYS